MLGSDADPFDTASAPLDAVLIVDAYHEMEQPVTLLRNAAKSLKPDGRASASSSSQKTGGGPGPEMDERVDPGTGDPRRAATPDCS